MKLKTAYLAGAINGLTYRECTTWRNELTKNLKTLNIITLDPMRGKEFLNIGDNFNINDSELDGNITTEEIFIRDMNDVKSCDFVIVNLEHLAKCKMFGTIWELGAAHALNKPIVAYRCPKSYLEHPFIDSGIEYHAETLDCFTHIVEDLKNVI